MYWSPSLDQWLITTFELVDEVLTDPTRFSSVGAEMSHISLLDSAVHEETRLLSDHFNAAQLNITDPPDHTRIRRAFGRAFVPREIAKFEDRMSAGASRLLEQAKRQSDVIDVIADFAEPLPVQVVSDIIGIPETHRDSIPSITLDQRYFFGTTPPDPERARQFADNLSEWHDLLTSWIGQRRAAPREDVLTRTAYMIDDGKLTLDEALATCLHLIIAGNGTTTASIGNTAYLLLSHPDQLAAVQDDPDLMANCVEESLRFETPLPRDRRIATDTCELGGEEIGKGEQVISVLAAANRDPSQFDRPDDFDIHRSFTPQQHASFGRGIHFCLGAPVARLETKIAITALLERFPSPRLAPGFRPDWHSITTHRGLVTLPIHSSMSRV